MEHAEAGACAICHPLDEGALAPPAPADDAHRLTHRVAAATARRPVAPVVVRRVAPAAPTAAEPEPAGDAAPALDGEALFGVLLERVCGEGRALVEAVAALAYEHDASSVEIEDAVRPVIAREHAFDLLPIDPAG